MLFLSLLEIKQIKVYRFIAPVKLYLSFKTSPCMGRSGPLMILSRMQSHVFTCISGIFKKKKPALHIVNDQTKYTWKFLLTRVFLSGSICRNFDRSPLIWLSILMMYWKSLCVRRFSTSIDCDMFCIFWKESHRAALIFPFNTRLKCHSSLTVQYPCFILLSQRTNQHLDLQYHCLSTNLQDIVLAVQFQWDLHTMSKKGNNFIPCWLGLKWG